MLLVALHSFQELPAPVAQAVSAVAEVLPAAEVSTDVADMPVDGPALPETAVPAGCLDQALPADVHVLQRGAAPKRPTETEEVPVALLDALDAVVGEGPEAEGVAMARIQAALTNKRLRRVTFGDGDGQRKG